MKRDERLHFRGTQKYWCMRTCLFSDDLDVISTVRAVLPDVRLNPVYSDTIGVEDCCLWDQEFRSLEIEQVLRNNNDCQVVLLVNPGEADTSPATGISYLYTLTKPLNCQTLKTFLDLTVKAAQLNRHAHHANGLNSDRQALMEYILGTHQRLQEYDHNRTSFLARALHDLRAPLTALQGYCGLLAGGQLGPLAPEQRELITRMQQCTRRLSKQATAMFELTVFGRVHTQPQLALADVDDMVAQAMHEAFGILQDKEQTVAVSLDPSEHPLFCDPEQIGQLLLNLLENCSRFAPVGSAIEVRGLNVRCDFTDEASARRSRRSEAGSNGYRIDMYDDGPGICEDLLSGLFGQYTPYSAGRDRSGGGLGLAVCKMIATAHEGFIWADNSHKGAVFSLVLPFRPVSTQDADGAVAESLFTVC